MSSERYYGTAVYVREWDDARDTWGDETVYLDAAIRQLDRHGRNPGPSYQLRVPRDADPETGEVLDVDGDRSMDRFYLHGADAYIDSETVSVEGYAPTSDFASTFTLVHWHQIPYAWILRRKAEASANAKGVDKLSDRDREVIVAMRKHAVAAKSSAGDPNPHWIRLYDGEPTVVCGVEITTQDIESLRDRKILMVTLREQEWVGSLRRKADTLSALLLRVGDDMADALIAKEVPAR